MADREAKIKIGVEGADEAVASANRVKGAFEGAGKGIGASFGKLGDVIGGAVSGMISDLTRVANVAQGINFVQAVANARQYQEAIGRMSISAGASVSDLRQSFEYLSKKTLVPEKEIAGFVSSIQKVTHDSQSAAQSFVGLSAAAIETGKSADDLAPLYSTMHNVLGISGDATSAFEKIKGTADSLGTVGGPGVLQDALQSVAGTLTQVSSNANTAIGLLGVLQGKSVDPGHGARAFQGLVGNIANRSVEYRHWLGMSTKDFYDSDGKIKISALAKMQQKFFKTYGHGNFAYDSAVSTFGAEGAAELFKNDFSKVPSASSKSLTGLDQFSASDAGKRVAAQNEAQRNARKSAEDKLPLLDSANDFISKHPLGANLAISAGGGVVSSVAGAAIKGAFGLLSSSTEGAAKALSKLSESGDSLFGVLAKAGSLMAAAGAGYAAGTAIDQAFGISDAISGTGSSSRIKEEDDKEFAKDEARRAARRAQQPVLTTTPVPNEDGVKSINGSVSTSVRLNDQGSNWQINSSPSFTIVNQTGGPIHVIDQHKTSSVKQ